MYKHLSRPKKQRSVLRPLSGGAILFFTALSVVAPAQIQHSDSRLFTSGLKIEIDHTSPPYAALEDVSLQNLDRDSIDPNPPSSNRVEKLAVGEGRPAQMALKILAENHRAQTIPVKINREELLQALFLPLVNAPSAPATQDPETVAGFGGGHVAAKAAPPATPAEPVRYAAARATTTSAPATTVVPTGKPLPAGLQTQALNEAADRLISGNLELANGLALTSANDEIVVYHEVEGAAQDQEGTVWLKDGRYRIEVSNLEGALVAELRSSSGEVLGRGRLDLVDLPLAKVSQYTVPNVDIELKPVQPGLSGHVIEARLTGKTKPLERASVDFESIGQTISADGLGQFDHPGFASGSTALVKAHQSGHWGTVGYAAADSDTTLHFYPSDVLKRLALTAKATRGDFAMTAQNGIVWGRVLNQGQPLAGAQVNLLTTLKPVQPIYFNNQMQPDPRLQATTANGMYAFIPVDGGTNVVQAQAHGQVSEPIPFLTEGRHVSAVNIETALSRRARLKAFDAFQTSQPLPAMITELDGNDPIQMDGSGEALLRYASGASPLAINVDSGAPYVPERFTTDRNQTYIYLPMIHQDWLTRLQQTRPVASPGTTTLVGFIQGSSRYEVVPPPDVEAMVIYFDEKGEPLPAERMGVPGGGFMLVGVHPGLQTVLVEPEGGEPVYSATSLVELGYVSVLNHSMR